LIVQAKADCPLVCLFEGQLQRMFGVEHGLIIGRGG
jgi:hypothetical protein